MSFNRDPAKQVFFSRKTSKRNHPALILNYNTFNLITIHKHLGMILDLRLNIDKHLTSMLRKIVKLLVSFENLKASSLEYAY